MHRRVKVALACILLFGALFAVQIATLMPPGVVLGGLDMDDYRTSEPLKQYSRLYKKLYFKA